MLVASLVALLSLATSINAQAPPACVLTCAEQFCANLADLQCLCNDQVSEITSCVLTSCDTADQATAAQLQVQECGLPPQINCPLTLIIANVPAGSSIVSSVSSVISSEIQSVSKFSRIHKR